MNLPADGPTPGWWLHNSELLTRQANPGREYHALYWHRPVVGRCGWQVVDNGGRHVAGWLWSDFGHEVAAELAAAACAALNAGGPRAEALRRKGMGGG